MSGKVSGWTEKKVNFRRDFRGWRFYIALTHSHKMEGVNSKLPDGRHFLMWDFDNLTEKEVIDALKDIQKQFKLPRVFLINTGIADHWHAYSFRGVKWGLCLQILAETKGIDPAYFKIGVIRGYFTLRYSPKRDRPFQTARIILSRYKEDVNPFELTNFCEYWTRRI